MAPKNINDQAIEGSEVIPLSGELTPSQLQSIGGGWINPLYHSSEGFWGAVYMGAVIAYASY